MEFPLEFQIGVPVMFMSLIWCLSPLLGFFLVPLLGSLSDRCRAKLGRRRPFILLFSAGIILGLALVPNGKNIGILFGDTYEEDLDETSASLNDADNIQSQNETFNVFFRDIGDNAEDRVRTTQSPYSEWESPYPTTRSRTVAPHPFSILFTVVGVILLDFSCDGCQSPCRAYMLDVTVPEDHNRGLSTFTVLAGVFGSFLPFFVPRSQNQDFRSSEIGFRVHPCKVTFLLCRSAWSFRSGLSIWIP